MAFLSGVKTAQASAAITKPEADARYDRTLPQVADATARDAITSAKTGDNVFVDATDSFHFLKPDSTWQDSASATLPDDKTHDFSTGLPAVEFIGQKFKNSAAADTNITGIDGDNEIRPGEVLTGWVVQAAGGAAGSFTNLGYKEAEIATVVDEPFDDASASDNAVKHKSIAARIVSLLGGVPVLGDTLKKLHDLITGHTADAVVHLTAAERIAWNAKADKIDNADWVPATGVLTINHTDGSNTVANIGVPNVLKSDGTGITYDAPTKTFTFTFIDDTTQAVPASDLFDATAFSDIRKDDVLKTITLTRLDTGTVVLDLAPWFAAQTDPTAETGTQFSDPFLRSLAQLDEWRLSREARIPLPGDSKPLPGRYHMVTGGTTLDGADVVAGGSESYFFDLAPDVSLSAPGIAAAISHTGPNHETVHLAPHPTNDGEFVRKGGNGIEEHAHEVLQNIAVHVRSAGTNASSAVDIELLLDGVWNPTDWVVSTAPVTGLTAHSGATVLHLDKAPITGPINIGHNKDGYLFFEHVGDATSGQLTGTNYVGTNGANSDGEIIVNFAGTNQAVTFANKAAVTATDLEFEQPEVATTLEIVRYTADGAIQDKDHRAIFETGAVNMTLAASTTDRLIQMVSEGPATIITADGAEEFTSSGGTSTDQQLAINGTFQWATIIGRTAGGWSQYVGQVGLPAGVDESTPTKFKAGTRLVQNGVNVGSGTVTFPEAFKAGTTPTVMILPLAPGDNINATLQSVSETGFNAWIVRNESDVGMTKDIHWMAIGEIA